MVSLQGPLPRASWEASQGAPGPSAWCPHCLGRCGLPKHGCQRSLAWAPTTPTVCFCHQPRPRRPSVCPASSLPVPGARVGGGRARSGCLGGGVYARLHRASQPRGVQNLDRGGWGGLAAPGDGDPADQAPALEGLWTW